MTASDLWAEDKDYPRRDWQYEVANGDTNLGYWDWVEAQREYDNDYKDFEASKAHPTEEKKCPEKK